MDKLKPGTKSWELRQQRHRHNGFRGSAVMMQKQCQGITASSTATDEAKRLAQEIAFKAVRLQEALKTRRPGT